MSTLSPILHRAIVSVIPPISFKGRSYWPPVFFGNSKAKSDTVGDSSLAAFGTCALSHFGSQDDRIYVDVEFGLQTGLVIKCPTSPSANSVPMEHSRHCPMRKIAQNPDLASTLLPPLPPVKVGVAVVIENQFKRVLITRRSSTMRTFPNVWVVPGGHMNIGESLAETAVREVFEETGIQINKDQVFMLAVYESVFPVLLTSGPPSDHHMVVYMKAIVNVPETSLCLQVFEVNAAAWISKDTVMGGLQMDHSPVPVQTFTAYELQNTVSAAENIEITTSLLRQTNYDISRLQSIMLPDGSVPTERLSTGCRFALREWLRSIQ